jgi:hypothetical protein
VRDIAEHLSQRDGVVSSNRRFSSEEAISSGITGTIKRLIDRPVKTSPMHIRVMDLFIDY